MTPLRILAYLDDESDNSWWITTNHGRTFMRTEGEWESVAQDRLTMVAHGHNDPELFANWPRTKQARFQPHRSLD